MALPAIADVRNARRHDVVAVAARASVAPLFSLLRAQGAIDDVVTLPPRGAWPLSGYDAAVLLPNSFHSALAVARAGVRERWGYRTDWRGPLLTRAVNPLPAGVPQIECYQRLVAALGCPNGASAPRIEIAPELRARGAALLRRAGWDGHAPLAAIAPGAAYGSAKRWPAAAFADLVDGLVEDGVATVMVGAAADRVTAAEVTRGRRACGVFVDLVGQTDIPALAGVLANCRAIVANDSGALHLAAAVGVPTVALFGPTDERLTAPRQVPRLDAPTSVVLTHDTWCRPCALRECPLDHRCMRGIGVDRVRSAARKAL